MECLILDKNTDFVTFNLYTICLNILKDAFEHGYDAGISIEPHMTVVFHDTDSVAPEQSMADNYVEYGRRLEKLIEEVHA